MKKINWVSILRDPQFIGFRITMIGVAMGFIALFIAVCGPMYLGISVFVVSLSIAVTGVLSNLSHVNRCK